MELSIVATVYNDAALVPDLVQQIKTAVLRVCTDFEIILVNDCSKDESDDEIAKACSLDSRVKGISLSRNYGQQIAMSAGMRYCSGNYVVILDGDLQNPPESIPELYSKIKEGYDLVYTTDSRRNSWREELSSQFFWWMLTRIFKVEVVKNQLMMKIMSKEFLRRYNSYSEQTRSVSGIVNDIGLKYAILKIKNNRRISGKSNYSFFKRFNHMLDVVISFSNAPLTMMIHFGWMICLLSAVLGMYRIYLYLFDNVQPGFTSILLSIFFFGSLLVLMLGFIGRYLANIYAEVKNRPLFDVQKKYNL